MPLDPIVVPPLRTLLKQMEIDAEQMVQDFRELEEQFEAEHWTETKKSSPELNAIAALASSVAALSRIMREVI